MLLHLNRPPGTIDPYKPFSENCWIFHAKKLWGQHNFPVNSLGQLLSWAFWKISSNGKWLLSPTSSQGPKSTLYEQDPTFWFDRLGVRIPEFSREHLDNKWLHAWSKIVYKSPYSCGTHFMGWDQSLRACSSYFIRGVSTHFIDFTTNPFHRIHSFHRFHPIHWFRDLWGLHIMVLYDILWFH